MAATLQPDRGDWALTVSTSQGVNLGVTTIPRLDEAERRARALLGRDGRITRSDQADISVLVQLPDDGELHLDMAEAAVKDATTYLDEAAMWLAQGGMSPFDIDAVLSGDRFTVHARPLTVDNWEIDAYGLASRPDVVGIVTDDLHGATYCRSCIDDAGLRPWAQRPPHSRWGLLYIGSGRTCDGCGREVATLDDDTNAVTELRRGRQRPKLTVVNKPAPSPDGTEEAER